MLYKVIYADGVGDDLLKLDRRLRKKIIDRIETYLARDGKVVITKEISVEISGERRAATIEREYVIKDEEPILVRASVRKGQKAVPLFYSGQGTDRHILTDQSQIDVKDGTIRDNEGRVIGAFDFKEEKIYRAVGGRIRLEKRIIR